MSAQAADGLDDFIHDGVTMTVVAGSRLAEVAARRKTQELQGGGDGDPQAQPVVGKPEPEVWKPWTADDIRKSRHHAEALKIHERFMSRAARATPDQQQQLQELSAQLGRPGMADAVRGISEEQAAAVIKQMEMAAQGQPLPIPEQVFVDEGLKSRTGLAPIESPDDSEAFLARLERSAAQRQGVPVEDIVVTGRASEAPAQPAAAPTRAPIMTGAKDPRTWATAEDPVTKPQAYNLKQQGFTANEIATLKKGSASYVIGHASLGPDAARDAFERNALAPPTPPLGDVPWAPSVPAVDDLTKLYRPNRSAPATDIRYQQKPPTQRP